MSERKFRREHREQEPTFEQAFQKLKEIVEVLKNLGLRVPEHVLDENLIRETWEEKSYHLFPIASNGSDGIRARRLKRRDLTEFKGTGFMIAFTNGFEDPKNPMRVEVTKKLREKGFKVGGVSN